VIDNLIERIKREPVETPASRFIDMTVFCIGLGFSLGTAIAVAVKLLG